MGKKKLFCEISPFTYAISVQKEVCRRHLKNLLDGITYAKQFHSGQLPIVVAAHESEMIKTGPGINVEHQLNKADNIRLACSKMNGLVIAPGESFSFWRYVGKTSKRNGFKDGRVLVNGKLVAGVGGGLCNLANTLHLLILDSPLTITEVHHHSDALAPDPEWKRIPYSAGTSVNYNYLDLRFKNNTEQPFQLLVWCADSRLLAELRTTKEYPYTYRLTEEDHHFHQEENGKYYRISKIYRETIDRITGNIVKRELNWNNHSEVMFDASLIPPELIR